MTPNIYEITAEKLKELIHWIIGDLDPVFETREDKKRFSRLGALIGMIDYFLEDIMSLTAYADKPEASAQDIGLLAKKWLEAVYERIGEAIKD